MKQQLGFGPLIDLSTTMITRIERREGVHYLFEDADFSAGTMKNLTAKREKDTGEILARYTLQER